LAYDALLVVSFGGPEGPDDVMPFLENVTRDRGVPRDRLLAVAEHYLHFGGVSPINEAVRSLIAALEGEIALPIHWGNRNWPPMLEDAVREMADAGVRRAIAFVTSAYGGTSSCRQYRGDIDRARAAVGERAPSIDKIRPYSAHPGFREAQAARVREAGAPSGAFHLFTAHSVPVAAAAGTPYEGEVRAASAGVAAALGLAADRWAVAWQSRSGAPTVPWLEPDVGDAMDALAAKGERDVCVVPIGFTADHMEVVWDLDHDARARADRAGVRMIRARTVGAHPRFVSMIRELVEDASSVVPCAPDCCGLAGGAPRSGTR
jgi:ferrochelatase